MTKAERRLLVVMAETLAQIITRQHDNGIAWDAREDIVRAIKRMKEEDE